ncbi:MAG: hypothetical protein ONB05_06700 [candidate division KSB1 bacterium]|nr:hypothetical protein [candidate division KSB1 bacterium]
MKPQRHFFLLIIFFITGCAAKKPILRQETVQFLPDEIDVFTGGTRHQVDPGIFISEEEKLQAQRLFQDALLKVQISDSLWPFIELLKESSTPAREDSQQTLKFLSLALDRLKEDPALSERIRRIQLRKSRLRSDDIDFVDLEILKSALSDLLASKKLDPFNPRLKIELIGQVFDRISERISDDRYFTGFIHDLEKVVWLEKERYKFYMLRGQVYLKLGQWLTAYEDFKLAAEVIGDRIVPAGVDSGFAVKADSLAQRFFVSRERRWAARALYEEANDRMALSDSLWNLYNTLSRTGRTASPNSQLITKGFEILWQDKSLQKPLKEIRKRKDHWLPDDVKFLSLELLKSAEATFLESKRLNPFELNTRWTLARQVYEALATRLQDDRYRQRAVEEMEHIVWVEKGRYDYYYYLAKGYEHTRDWARAFENYQKAEQALLKTAIFRVKNPQAYFDSPESVPVDSSWLYACLFGQVRAKERLYQGKEALKILERALAVAPEIKKDEALRKKTWLSWDDGNVRASEVRDSVLYKLELQEKKYKDAKAGYLYLLNLLWTQRTRNEINYRIARLQFEHLNEKDEGIDRLWKVVREIPKDSIGAPLEPQNSLYFDWYGNMCYVLGREYREKEDLRTAYIYFAQGTTFHWRGRARCYLELAELSTYNATETIELCYKALNFKEGLDSTCMRRVAELLASAYKKDGKLTDAREWIKRSRDKDWCEKKAGS